MRRALVSGLLVLSVLLPDPLEGQQADFSGIKVFINPGHGGHDSDDRHMIATDFWESDGNLEKGLFLRDLLQARNADVYMSRTTNFTSDDLPLSTIAEMANTANADIFLSIHSNGYDGTRNQPLVLFRGYDDDPVFPAARVFSQILWGKLFEKGNCWTHTFEWVKGDWTFYPEWGDKVGLGVLRTLNMPGVLSEGSFHDYIPEGWRLRNGDFLHHEAWAMLRALEEFENVTAEPTGIIAGTVRNALSSPDYYFKPGTRDEATPFNSATVTLKPGDMTVTTDNLNNGFFMFDSLPPGNYELICSGILDFFNDTLAADVIAGKSTLTDFFPPFDTTRAPTVVEFAPVTTDSLPFNQTFTITFDIPMDQDSVEAALVTEPAADFVFGWDDRGKTVTISPETGFTGKTSYTMRLTTRACSRWKVFLQSEFQVSFVTKSRSFLVAEKVWPSSGLTGVTLYPRITMWFDAPLEQASASEGIRLINSQSEDVTKIREAFLTEGGKGSYSFELSSALQHNSQYRLVMAAGVKDITGVALGNGSEISFTTRAGSYDTGNTIESFDNISVFWDPEASGSTVGTDNPLTTFTTSTDILRSGSAAGKLEYVFTGASGGLCRVFDTGKPSIGSNTTQLFAMWVYGDLSGNKLEYWFYSPGTVNQIVGATTINWAGWDLISIPISSIGAGGPWQYHSIVIRQTSTGSKKGTMYFDDAMVITPTGVDDEVTADTELLISPNPASSAGRVTFFISSPCQAELNLYGSDGSLVVNLFGGRCGQGHQIVDWQPSSAVAPGVYTLRLSIRKEGETLWHHVSRRWVLIP
jgi:hypothetical protein